jgi:hypothetical protein
MGQPKTQMENKPLPFKETKHQIVSGLDYS